MYFLPVVIIPIYFYQEQMNRLGGELLGILSKFRKRNQILWQLVYHDEIHRDLKSQTPADVRLFNRRTSAGELCRSNQLFTAHLLGGDKFSYQRNSCTSTRFRFNKKLNYKLAALEVFLPNRNAFASVVASLKIYCTSRRVILRTSYWGIFHCIFCLLVFIKH